MWKDIPEFVNWQINENGDIRRVSYMTTDNRRIKELFYSVEKLKGKTFIYIGKGKSLLYAQVAIKLFGNNPYADEIPDLENEEWKEITNHSNYMISNKGRVKRIQHFTTLKNGEKRLYKEKLIKPLHLSGSYNRYLAVILDGQILTIHRLVASHFISKIDDGLVVDHIDNDPENNDLSNLRIVTYTQNKLNPNNKKYERRKKKS